MADGRILITERTTGNLRVLALGELQAWTGGTNRALGAAGMALDASRIW